MSNDAQDGGSALKEDDHEIEEAKHDKPHLVEVTVDGHKKKVESGTYAVSAFKALVGVSADRELDRVDNGMFVPLDDAGSVKIEKHEVFVSHVRTGGSS